MKATDKLSGAWHELKGKVTKKWGELTNDEVSRMEGRYEELSGHIQRKYGVAKEEADRQIDDFINSHK